MGFCEKIGHPATRIVEETQPRGFASLLSGHNRPDSRPLPHHRPGEFDQPHGPDSIAFPHRRPAPTARSSPQHQSHKSDRDLSNLFHLGRTSPQAGGMKPLRKPYRSARAAPMSFSSRRPLRTLRQPAIIRLRLAFHRSGRSQEA